MKLSKKHGLLGLLFLSCAVMAWVDAVLQPGYFLKSLLKILLFLGLPLLYGRLDGELSLRQLFIPTRRELGRSILVGFGVYGLILGAYFLLRPVFDFSAVTGSLSRSVGVTAENFFWVALYISLVNSLLEEFFFRGFAFLTLRRIASRKSAYLWSASAFALYHIAMMLGWFSPGVLALAILALLAGGLFFNACNEKSGTIYPSWLIHMFANFAINTVGFFLFGLL